MKKVNHVNYMDNYNRVYCRLRKKVVVLDELQERDYCSACKMWAGSAQGIGVECEWEDVRDVPNPYVVTNPDVERNYITTAEAKK